MPQIVLVILALFALNACNRTTVINEDGSQSVMVDLTSEQIRKAVEAGLGTPRMKNIQVDFAEGYITTTADWVGVARTIPLSLRMTLEAVDGDLQVTISEVKAHNVPVTQARIDHWNTAISRALNRFDARTPNTDIEAITVSTDGVTVTFNRQ